MLRIRNRCCFVDPSAVYSKLTAVRTSAWTAAGQEAMQLRVSWLCSGIVQRAFFELPWEEKQETGCPPCKQINGTRSGDVRRRKLCIALVSVHSFIRCQRTELGKAFVFGLLTQGRTGSQFRNSPC